jgi:thioredoxin 1
MFERLLWLTAFALLLVVTYLAWRLMLARQTRRLALAAAPAPVRQLPLGDGPAVLYFTTPTCAQCRLQQTPILAQVQRQRSDMQLIKLDALEHQALADYYRVMTVPTTVVLDSQRRPIAVNHGLATAERLQAQIAQATALRNS